MDFPSDAQKIKKIKLLVDNGFSDKILISQDIHTKHRMVRFKVNDLMWSTKWSVIYPLCFVQTCYGGHGYAHILEHVVPKMQDRGIPLDVVTQIITKNPQTWLTFQ